MYLFLTKPYGRQTPAGKSCHLGGGLQRGIINRPSIEKGLDKLIVTQNILSIYPSVHNQLIRTLFEVNIVYIIFFGRREELHRKSKLLSFYFGHPYQKCTKKYSIFVILKYDALMFINL